MTDPIADLLTRIRNAQVARQDTTVIPHSKMKLGIVKILQEEGFIGAYQIVEGEKGGREIHLTLRYAGRKEPIIADLHRVSRPGRRQYMGYKDIRPVRSGLGIAIFSTPKGILTDRQAREEKVGGELLCTVW